MTITAVEIAASRLTDTRLQLARVDEDCARLREQYRKLAAELDRLDAEPVEFTHEHLDHLLSAWVAVRDRAASFERETEHVKVRRRYLLVELARVEQQALAELGAVIATATRSPFGRSASEAQA